MEEQVYEAELVDGAALSDNGATRSLNTALGATIAVVLVFLMMSRSIGAPLQDQAVEESFDGYTPIADRHLKNYYTDGQNSYVLKIKTNGEIEKIFKLPSKLKTNPIVANSSIFFLGSKNKLYVID